MNRLLHAFTRWALARSKPAPASSSQARGLVAYTIADYVTGGPYLTRVVFPRILGIRPLLHLFHRSDVDRALHNHPWKWSFSIILRGSYTEERLGPPEWRNGTEMTRSVRTRRVRWFNWITCKDYHRISELHGEVWTLFVSGPRTQDWGFLVDGKPVSHVEYFKQFKAAP